MTKRNWRYIEDAASLDLLAAALERADRIALDTESDSMYSYFEKVCLVQIATPDAAFLVDPLKLDGRLAVLGPALAEPGKQKILHGADYDIVSLKRDFHYEFHNVFDTMVAAQFVGQEKFGLADLVSEAFGETLEKKYARTNWARRPLSDSELRYAYLDVKYLIGLADIMRRRLDAADVLEEAELEFRRLEARPPATREFDPDGYRRIRGRSTLSDPEQSVLRELFVMRDRHARRLDRPPFKILANETMLRIARTRPASKRELRGIRGVSDYVIRRFGEGILKSVTRGLDRGRPPAPRAKKPRSVRLHPRQQLELERLKDWRRETAARRGVPGIVVLPNHAILDVVRMRPRDVSALAALPAVGEKRARLYGEAILAILSG